jgi:hypothetical protein
MTNSRNKGANGEREVAAELFAELGIRFQRNLEQTRSGGGDLVPDDSAFPFLCEIKRRADGYTCPPAWEAQVFKAARDTGLHPVVIYRFDRQKWRCRVWFDAIAEAVGGHAVCGQSADVTIQGLAWLAREIMARRAEK